MAYDIVAQFANGSKLAQLTNIPVTSIVNNGTGIATGAPIAVVIGANTVTTTTKGTFLIYLAPGYTGTVTSAGATVTGSPVTLVEGWNTITTTTTGTITVTIACTTTQTTIEILGLRSIYQAVIGASLSGGYKLDPAACTIAGNKVTITPMYYNYAGANGVAIAVPNTVDLNTVTCNLTVIGY